MDDFKSDTAKLIQNFMVGLMCVVLFAIAVGGLVGVPFMIADRNNQKVQNMTKYCMEQGFDGWSTEDIYVSRQYLGSSVGCYKNGDRND